MTRASRISVPLLSLLVTTSALVAPLRARSADGSLTTAAKALRSQLKRTWGLSLVCGCALDNSTDSSGYYISKTLYNMFFETGRFIHFTRNPPTDPNSLHKLFERFQTFTARIDEMLAQPARPGIHLPRCLLQASWQKVKDRMADVSQAFGSSLVPDDPPLEIPEPTGIEDPEAEAAPGAAEVEPPAAGDLSGEVEEENKAPADGSPATE